MRLAVASVATVAAPVVVALLAGACSDPAALRVVATAEQGNMTQSPWITGRDGGGSALVFGQSVWVFGDTVLAMPDAEGSSWHHNSYALTDDLAAGDGLDGLVEPAGDATGAPRYFVAPTAEEKAFNDTHAGEPCAETPCGARWAVWPGEPVWDAAGARALVFYGLIYAEPGSFNFHGVGTGIGVWRGLDEPVERPELRPGTEHPTLLFDADEPAWGTGAQIIDGDLYTFGCSDGTFDKPCRLARVPVADVLDRAAWRFWDGAAWVSDWHDATTVFDGAPIMSVAWNDHLGVWLAVYSSLLSDRVVARTAPRLTGPWSDATTLFTARRVTDDDGWTYDAVQHAELAEDGGRVIWVSHTRPNGNGWFGADLVLWRVELDKP